MTLGGMVLAYVSTARKHVLSKSYCVRICRLECSLAEFASDTVWPRQGDRFVRFTDGLLEVIDKSGAEFGLEGIKAVLWSSEHDTLRALAERILQAARAFGYYDESLLVARC